MAVPWWQHAVVYQVYPWSFADASGDGIGDLVGIRSRLSYLAQVGVDAVWLSPIFRSPMADFGYDIADYTDVDPRFGTLAELDDLLSAAHALDMRVILDLVPNHTSDEHAWFVDSRSSRDSARRDWYLWRDAAPDGGPPNNWESVFGGSAWEWDEHTQQYYLHLFNTKQPDLNWRNADVRSAMYDVMRFWFRRGIDGFRIDVLWLLVKDADLRDNPPPRPPDGREVLMGHYDRPMYEDLPETRAVAHEMRAVADEFDSRVLIGEIYLPVDRLVRYYGDDLRGIHLPFNFSLVTAGGWDAATVRRVVDEYEAALPVGAWPNWVLGNHDVPRIASRVGQAAGRVAQMLLLTLRGTPTCYYGDELGLPNGALPPLDRGLDPQARVGFDRSACRTPMQWDSGPNAGFCGPEVRPWLPVQPDWRERNVSQQMADPQSHLALFRRLIELRRARLAFRQGSYREVRTAGQPEVLAYVREHEADRVLVVLSFGEAQQQVDLSRSNAGVGQVVCSTGMDRQGSIDLSAVTLRGNEGLVIDLS